MKTIGIIAEYNPFHNGHIYHLKKIKELFPDSRLVLVLSGNFTQRGLPSIINKWDKTKIALQYGIDLVIELPYPFATQSADIFAKGAIEILNEINCDYLVFGSESNNIEELKELANIQIKNPELNKLIDYKRKEEKSRIGGIPEDKDIINFDYMKLDFNDDLINSFNKMQRIYVMDNESVITIDDVKNTIQILLEVFRNL